MKGALITVGHAPDDLLQYVASRDAALWIGRGCSSSAEQIELLVKLIRLPWRLVVVEDDSEALAKAVGRSPPAI